MTTTRLKDKISSLVSSQLPEFIQTDYTTFVNFIEAYYRFLEQDQGAQEIIQNARSYNDLDRTTAAFIEFFLDTYAQDISVNVLADKKLLIKKIKDLYESKGSSVSFDLLFNILFQSTVDILYPFENVLKASGGRWQQRVAINIETVTGNRDAILNRSLLYTSNGQDYSTPIVDVKNYSDSLTQVFLDTETLAQSYTIGDDVEVRDANGTIFSGVIAGTPTTFSIQRAGLGFKVGQIYNINFGGGIGTLVRVSNVSNVGAILDLKFVSFGTGYTSNTFNVDLDRTKSTSETVDIISDFTQGFGSYGNVYGFNQPDDNTQGFGSYGIVHGFNRPDDRTQGFGSSGVMFGYDPTDSSRYFEETYISSNGLYVFNTIPATFDDSVFNADTDTFTTLRTNLATFNDNVFSAATDTFTTLRTDLASFNDNVFSSAASTSTKPAGIATVQFRSGGLARFPGSFITNESFLSELDVRLENDIQYHPFAYQTNTDLDISDFFDIVTQLIHPAGQRLFNNRVLSSTLDLSANVNIVASTNIFGEALSVFDVLDVYSANISKPQTDLFGVFESNTFVLTKVETDNVLAQVFNTLSIEPVYTDNVAPNESLTSEFSTSLEDVSQAVEEATLAINKSVLNISNVSLSESAIGTIQGYFAESYVSENYTGIQFTLV